MTNNANYYMNGL